MRPDPDDREQTEHEDDHVTNYERGMSLEHFLAAEFARVVTQARKPLPPGVLEQPPKEPSCLCGHGVHAHANSATECKCNGCRQGLPSLLMARTRAGPSSVLIERVATYWVETGMPERCR